MFQRLELLLGIGVAGLPAVHGLLLIALRVVVDPRLLDAQLGLEGLQVFPGPTAHVQVPLEAR